MVLVEYSTPHHTIPIPRLTHLRRPSRRPVTASGLFSIILKWLNEMAENPGNTDPQLWQRTMYMARESSWHERGRCAGQGRALGLDADARSGAGELSACTYRPAPGRDSNLNPESKSKKRTFDFS